MIMAAEYYSQDRYRKGTRMRSAGLLSTGLLAIILTVASNPSLRRMLLPEPPEAPNSTKGDLKVWVNRRSGFYYCPSSNAYGSMSPGEFMTQASALQTGFRPAPHVPCIETSPSKAIASRPKLTKKNTSPQLASMVRSSPRSAP